MKFSRATITTIVELNLLLKISLTKCFITPSNSGRSSSFPPTTFINTRPSSSSLHAKSSLILNDEESINSDMNIIISEELKNRGKRTTPDRISLPNGYFSNSTAIEELPSSSATSPKTNTSLERAMRERAYPLFILEKMAQLIEDAFPFTSSPTQKVSDTSLTTKEHIVVIGTGWGSAAFIKGIDTSRYDVTVVSPRNFFLFTPMLAGASVGTLEFRSITEPVRHMNSKVDYLEATVTSISPTDRTLTCEPVLCEWNSCAMEEDEVTLSYDRLVFAVGAQTNTFGIPGVEEYCDFLKSIEDAKAIRTAIVNLFERASFPGLTEEEKVNILTFAVIGAGPTGVEFASELRDFVENDGPIYYPRLLKYVRIKVIEAASTILAPFDKSLQNKAMSRLTRPISIADPDISRLLPEDYELTEILLESGVTEVKEKVICLKNGQIIPYGLAVWAAGNGPLPITLSLIDTLAKESDSAQKKAQEVARGRVAVDPWLRVLGSGGEIYSLGDCSCFVANNGSVQLPATAQVAAQQGEYLARLLSRHGAGVVSDDSATIYSPFLLPPVRSNDIEPVPSEHIAGFAMQNNEIVAPFQFWNLGILAYTGGESALAQFQVTPDDMGLVKGWEKVGYGLWRGVYMVKQVSWRNRFLVFTDWIKAKMFGRDITRM